MVEAKESIMKIKFSQLLILLTSLFSLAISLYLTYISGYVIDENNLSGASYYGGEMGLLLNWLRLGLLLICVVAAVAGFCRRK